MQPASDSIAERIGETHKIGVNSFAALSLFAANAGMLLIYFALDLTLFQLVFVYWWEALWIGLFSGLKLLTASLLGDPYNNRWVDVPRSASFFVSLFAVVKSGAAFITLLALSGVALVFAQQEMTGVDGNDFVREQAGLILKCSTIFLLGHGVSFIINFIILGEFRHARFGTLVSLPFKRGLALFVTIVATLTATQIFPGLLGDTAFAAFLITVKLVWDYFLHRRERLSFTISGIHKEPRV